MAIAYGIMLVVAIALLVLYCTLIRIKAGWMVVLFASICLVNLGYLLLSVSATVGFALFANKVAYLGQIFILISMYLTIARLSGFKFNKKLAVALILIGVLVFAMICTTGYLPWYYKSVSLEYVDGAAKLVKEYGPLHVVYLIYVLTYFALMVGTIAISIHSKMVSSSKHAGLLTAVVLCNIAMWIVEKFVAWNFEFLSISYILSEGMLFFLYWMMQDYVHKDDIPASVIVEEKHLFLLWKPRIRLKEYSACWKFCPRAKGFRFVSWMCLTASFAERAERKLPQICTFRKTPLRCTRPLFLKHLALKAGRKYICF